MDYDFFEQLSTNEARRYLARYRKIESQKAERLVQSLRVGGVQPGFSFDALPSILTWVAERVEVTAAEVSRDAPAWIRVSMEAEHGGFRDFAEGSKEWVLTASYFLGETFVREEDRLSWTVGRSERAELHQPVVTGFRTDADLPVLLVAENLYLRTPEPEFEDRARTLIATWRDAI